MHSHEAIRAGFARSVNPLHRHATEQDFAWGKLDLPLRVCNSPPVAFFEFNQVSAARDVSNQDSHLFE